MKAVIRRCKVQTSWYQKRSSADIDNPPKITNMKSSFDSKIILASPYKIFKVFSNLNCIVSLIPSFFFSSFLSIFASKFCHTLFFSSNVWCCRLFLLYVYENRQSFSWHGCTMYINNNSWWAKIKSCRRMCFLYFLYVAILENYIFILLLYAKLCYVCPERIEYFLYQNLIVFFINWKGK